MTMSGAAMMRWVVAPPSQYWERAHYGEMPPLVADILGARGIHPDHAAAFLAAHAAPLGPPEMLSGVIRAVSRIHDAYYARETICVYGDYDADGLTAQAVLVTALRAWNFPDVRFYTPHRDREGYGLNAEALTALAADGVNLVIAVDCGISDAAAIAAAREQGLEVIVVDHHRIPAVLPDAAAIVNPHAGDTLYPYCNFAAVGVVYTLVRSIVCGSAFPRPSRALIDRMLALVALGTVADVVPLTGENRTLVAAGLRALRRTTHPGLRALIEIAHVPFAGLDTGHIAFALAPRLNAPGRLRGADAVHRLLMPESEQDARLAAFALEEANVERRQEQERVLAEAIARVESDPAHLSEKLLFVGGEGWSGGVIGLVAAKLVERYGRPAFVYERGETTSKGSARGIGGFDIGRALAANAHLCIKQGGHPKAGGFTAANEHLNALREALLRAADTLTANDLTPVLHLDVEATHADLTMETVDDFACLAPFGQGNPEPTLLVRGVQVRYPKAVGSEGQHLMFTAALDNRATVRCIAFGMGEREPELRQCDRVDLAATLQRDVWQGDERLQLRVRDFRPA